MIKTNEENILADKEFLTNWYETFGVESLIDLVSKRNTFLNARVRGYREQLVEAGIDPRKHDE